MEEKIEVDQLLNKEHLKLLQILDQFSVANNLDNLNQIIEEIKIIEKYSFDKKIIMLWDHVKFLPIYLSENIIKFGYTPAEVYKMGLFQAMKRVYWKQIPLMVKIHKDGHHFRQVTKTVNQKNQKVFLYGAKLKNRWGQVRIFFGKQKFLSTNKKGQPTISFIEVEDITHIHKGETAWARMVDTTYDIPIIRTYFNDKKITNDLLSNRELEILRLITQNYDGTAIAQKLSISVETVKKHRKNMLAKTGLKDMTGLIYILQECELT